MLIEKDSLNNNYEIIAQNEHKEIMGIQHKVFNISGGQFHPESIKTENGKKILLNFLSSK